MVLKKLFYFKLFYRVFYFRSNIVKRLQHKIAVLHFGVRHCKVSEE